MSNENIKYEFNEIENENENEEFNEEIHYNLFMNELEENDYDIDSNRLYTEIINYELNFNVKQLSLICEYYGFFNLKKFKKMEIIEQIVLFENDSINSEIVLKRKELWNYITELKNDKFMKKYILW